MLLELNVYWYPEDYDPEEDEFIRKKELVMVKGIMVINTDHIVAFDPHNPSGDTMVRLTNGEVFRSDMKFEHFREIMEQHILSKDIFCSGES
jgi:hypothetical protein